VQRLPYYMIVQRDEKQSGGAMEVADALVERIRSPLAGESPEVQGATIAQLCATFVAGHHPRRVGAGTFYFVNLGLEVVGGVGAAGERLNVSQRFQPAGRFALANSP
jgi:hypothetical protein